MKRRLTFIRLFLIVLLFAAHVWIFRGFVVDDAFITFRYVQQWTHGNGLVYNIGDRVEGYSNFLWILLLAPFSLLGISIFVQFSGVVYSLERLKP